MRKRGFTIVELLVSMSIFVVIMTLAIGAFVSINRFRNLGNNMTESQQKLRLATELITRLARQAGEVKVTGNKTLFLVFNPSGLDPNDSTKHAGQHVTVAKFEIVGDTLNYYPETVCKGFNSTTKHCDVYPDFANPVSLLASGNEKTKIVLNPVSGFFDDPSHVPITLEIKLDGEIKTETFSADHFIINTETVLENIGGLN